MAFRPPVLGRYFKVYCMIYTFCRSELLQYSTCLGLRASLAAICIQSIQPFDLERTGFLETLLLGRFSKYPSRTLLCAVQMRRSGHRMDLLALSPTNFASNHHNPSLELTVFGPPFSGVF